MNWTVWLALLLKILESLLNDVNTPQDVKDKATALKSACTVVGAAPVGHGTPEECVASICAACCDILDHANHLADHCKTP